MFMKTEVAMVLVLALVAVAAAKNVIAARVAAVPSAITVLSVKAAETVHAARIAAVPNAMAAAIVKRKAAETTVHAPAKNRVATVKYAVTAVIVKNAETVDAAPKMAAKVKSVPAAVIAMVVLAVPAVVVVLALLRLLLRLRLRLLRHHHLLLPV
jgi:hypothetical protein